MLQFVTRVYAFIFHVPMRDECRRIVPVSMQAFVIRGPEQSVVPKLAINRVSAMAECTLCVTYMKVDYQNWTKN
jgi:hypothetical protein